MRQLTNSSGIVSDTYEYDSFGNEVNHTGTTPNNYLYRAEQYDSDLGLYYLRARYLDMVTGRFLSQDPENGIVTDPKTLHKYIYAGGDPVNFADPSGKAQAAAGTMGGAAGEYAGLIMNISIATVAAVDVLACGVNIQLAMDALRVDGYTDVVPVWYLCSARGKRVSCRFKVYIHPIGTPNHNGIGPFVAHAVGWGCTDACSIAKAKAYALADAAAPRGYHIQHEKEYCPE